MKRRPPAVCPHCNRRASIEEVEAALRKNLDGLARRLKQAAEARGEIWTGDDPGPALAEDGDDGQDGAAAAPLSPEAVALGLIGHRAAKGAQQ